MKINTSITLDVEDFALSLSYDEASFVIKAVDAKQLDANFTFEMAEHFVREVLRFDSAGDWTEELKLILEGKK